MESWIIQQRCLMKFMCRPLMRAEIMMRRLNEMEEAVGGKVFEREQEVQFLFFEIKIF